MCRDGNDIIARITSQCCYDVTVVAVAVAATTRRQRRRSAVQTESAEGARVAEKARAEGACI